MGGDALRLGRYGTDISGSLPIRSRGLGEEDEHPPTLSIVEYGGLSFLRFSSEMGRMQLTQCKQEGIAWGKPVVKVVM